MWLRFADGTHQEQFTDEGAIAFAREIVADLRAASARRPGDTSMRVLIAELLERSREFAGLCRPGRCAPTGARPSA